MCNKRKNANKNSTHRFNNQDPVPSSHTGKTHKRFLISIYFIWNADIDLFIDTLHYCSRWFSIWSSKLCKIHKCAFSWSSECWAGKWAGLKITKSLHLDQNHEQFNDYLKKLGDIFGLTGNPVALKRFLVSATLITELCSDFDLKDHESLLITILS